METVTQTEEIKKEEENNQPQENETIEIDINQIQDNTNNNTVVLNAMQDKVNKLADLVTQMAEIQKQNLKTPHKVVITNTTPKQVLSPTEEHIRGIRDMYNIKNS